MNLRADGDGGLYSTVPHRAVRMAQRSEAVSEEMRILYVALTRARDKVIVTAPLQNPEKTLSALATTLAARAARSRTRCHRRFRSANGCVRPRCCTRTAKSCANTRAAHCCLSMRRGGICARA